MEKKRQRRRRDVARMKAKAVRIGRQHHLPGNWARLYNHLAECSGRCCGNPRKWFGEVTIQERRFLCEPVTPWSEA